jgi:hypothetical protein
MLIDLIPLPPTGSFAAQILKRSDSNELKEIDCWTAQAAIWYYIKNE